MSKRLFIYFTCPTDLIIQDYNFYLELVKHIRSKGYITHDWVESAHRDLTDTVKVKEKGNKDFNQLKLKGVDEADLVIAEMSTKSIGVIHQITTALQKSKPTLLLLPKNDNDAKINAISSDWLIQKKYDDLDDAKKTITEFMDTFANNRKVRINLVISAFENRFLIKQMNITNKSKTEIIRNLIKNEADKELTNS